jgi:hypothetical protein
MYGTVRKVSAEGTIITVDLDGSDTPAIVRAGAVVIETILRDTPDWPHCRCNNTPDMDGFTACLADGTPVEPLADGPWDGKLLVCLRCGRVINQETLVVSAHVDPDEVMLKLDP